MDAAYDMRDTIVPKSDQLNADDLMAGDITVKIIGASVTKDGEQPVTLKVEGHRPWKPCKTMRRVLVEVWGSDAKNYIGKWVTLYRDPRVTWAGDEVGGVRIRAMSDINGARVKLNLTSTRGKKQWHTIEKLTPPSGSTTSAPKRSPLDQFLGACESKLTLKSDDVKAWASAESIDLAGMDAAGLKDVFDSLKEGGASRASFDTFLKANPVEEGDYE